MILKFRCIVFIFCISICSSFAISSRSVTKRKLPDFRNVVVINNQQSIPKQVASNGSELITALPAMDLASYVRRKKSVGLGMGALLNLVPAHRRYDYLSKMLPFVTNLFLQPNRFSNTNGGRQYGIQSIQQPGGIAFPSLEGALLSLAFLTFAVFLVDLVQQVLGRVNTGAGAVPLAGRSSRWRRRRKRRGVETLTFDGLLDDKFGEVFSTLSSNIITAIENPLYPDMNKEYK